MKISIITASYNYENFIKEAIESVLNQTYSDWELVVVDDGSKDNSLEVINSYAQEDSRIKVFTHPNNVNKGLAETVKLGISKASGEYIAFLESDDIWVEDHLEQKIKIAQKYPDVALIFNSIKMFGDEESMSEYIGYFEFQKEILGKSIFPKNIFNWMLLSNLVPTFSCVMVKQEALQKCTLDTPFLPWLDWGLWLQLAYKNDFYYSPMYLTKWRMHKKSYINTSSKGKKNNNRIIKEFVKNIFASETNPIKKMFLANYYSFIMIFLKMNRKLVKKFIENYEVNIQ